MVYARETQSDRLLLRRDEVATTGPSEVRCAESDGSQAPVVPGRQRAAAAKARYVPGEEGRL